MSIYLLTPPQDYFFLHRVAPVTQNKTPVPRGHILSSQKRYSLNAKHQIKLYLFVPSSAHDLDFIVLLLPTGIETWYVCKYHMYRVSSEWKLVFD